MPFQPGRTKTGGRALGVPNKDTVSSKKLQKRIEELGIDIVSVFFASWQKIKDPGLQTKRLLGFMEFIYPKQKYVLNELDIDDAIRQVKEYVESERIRRALPGSSASGVVSLPSTTDV